MTRVDELLPVTKLVLGVSAAVQILYGLNGIFYVGAVKGLLWTSPLPAWPREIVYFAAPLYLAAGLSAAFALLQNRWAGARVYFAYSFPYVAMSIAAVVVLAFHPGVPPIMWVYVLLSLLYLPTVAYCWIRQSRR